MHAKTYISVVTIFFVMSISSLFMDRAFSQATACTHYASPTGTGNGLSQSSPFKISDFWPKAKAGQTLCLLDGTYTGSNSMIFPPENLNGTSGSPITVRALNDGKVLINGQGIGVPIHLYHNNWFVIQGVNACCSKEDVVGIFGSSHNVISGVAGWNAADANRMIFALAGGTDNLLEDIAGWGIARKILESCCDANFTTVRRFWGRWDGSHFVGPKMTLSLAYDNYDMLVENSIGAWSGSAMNQTYTLGCNAGVTYSKCGQTFTNYQPDQPQGIFSVDGFTSGHDKNARSKLLGSIAYVQGTDKYSYSYVNLINRTDSITLENNVAYVQPGFYSNVSPFGLFSDDVAGNNLAANKLTSLGTAKSVISGWKTSDILQSASTSALYSSEENIFNTTRGANLCYQYHNGALTKQPLWPWPMNQRIKDAMIASGKSPVDVTATIESMFGPIPSACKSTTSTTAVSKPSAPINLQAQR